MSLDVCRYDFGNIHFIANHARQIHLAPMILCDIICYLATVVEYKDAFIMDNKLFQATIGLLLVI